MADIDYGGERLYNLVFAGLPFVTKSVGDDLDAEVARVAEMLAKRGILPVEATSRASGEFIRSTIYHLFDEFAPNFQK